MDTALPKLMELCSTVIQPTDETRKRIHLAVKVVKLKNQSGLDFSNPIELCVDGKNPLYEACRAGNFAIVKLFIANGANLNVVDKSGMSPLCAAISYRHGNEKTVHCILEAGADVNLYKNSRSPLLAAFYSMKINMSIELIQRGAEVNDAVLPSFCFVESVFALNSNLVMVASGVRFHLEEFDQLMNLSLEIIKAGLTARTFYLTGKKSFREEFTSGELSALWHFQSLCLAVGFKVDRYSLHNAISELHQVINDATDTRHRQSLYKQMDNFHIMNHINTNPLSLTRLTRISIRTRLVSVQMHPAKHLNDKIDLLPVPRKLKDFLALKEL